MNYLEQTANTIRIFLVEGNFSKEQFNLLKESSCTWKNILINFGILGESHFVNFLHTERDVPTSFTEICACTSASFNPETSTLHLSNYLSELPMTPITQIWNAYTYTFVHKKVKYNDSKKLVANLLAQKSKSDTVLLEYTFPGKTFFHTKPLTAIGITTTDTEISIQTVHTYPNENISVFTNSTLKSSTI